MKKNKEIDEIWVLMGAYILTIGLSIAWSILTTK
jgi:hypothetical protein